MLVRCRWITKRVSCGSDGTWQHAGMETRHNPWECISGTLSNLLYTCCIVHSTVMSCAVGTFTFFCPLKDILSLAWIVYREKVF